MRRRIEFLADQAGWLLGDVACLVMVAVFMPLVPVFKAFDHARRDGKDD